MNALPVFILLGGTALVGAQASTSHSAGVYEAHDRQPTTYGAVTRQDCDTCACLPADSDHDCDDHGVPEDGGWLLANVVLAIGVGGVLCFANRHRGER